MMTMNSWAPGNVAECLGFELSLTDVTTDSMHIVGCLQRNTPHRFYSSFQLWKHWNLGALFHWNFCLSKR